MPKSPTPPNLLEQLRAQSEALRAKDGVAARPVEENLRELDRRLANAFRWLDEAARHLEVIRPEVRHIFSLPGIISIARPKYERGFVSHRRRPIGGFDALDYVELFYRLSLPDPLVLRVQPAAAAGVEESLRAAQLGFRYDVEKDERRVVTKGVFIIAPQVTASVRFLPDYRRYRVEVTLRNVDRFEPVILDFDGDGLDEPALEDLVHLMLGESNKFLRRAPLARLTGDPTGAPNRPARPPVRPAV